jgi:hypothetical protein
MDTLNKSNRGTGCACCSYGSKGWGFESLRACQVRSPLPSLGAAFLVLMGATLGATDAHQPPNRALHGT